MGINRSQIQSIVPGQVQRNMTEAERRGE